MIHFKSYFKFLSRNKAYTLINVFGLSISLMFVILIGVYTIQEYSVDKQISKADRIYVLGNETGGKKFTGSHWRIQSKLRSRYPEIEKTCAMTCGNCLFKNDAGQKFALNMILTDSTFYDLFDFQLIRGDRHHVLDAPGKAVISEECARKLFGDTDPIGQTIHFNDSIVLTVSGIMEPLQNTSLQPFNGSYHGNVSNSTGVDMITRFELLKQLNSYYFDESMANATGTEIFILTRPGAHLENKTADMKAYFKTFFWFYMMPGVDVNVNLTRLDKFYFSGIQSSNGNLLSGDKKLVNILFAVGLVILLFALMNYINLTVAQSGFRAKEMATRRLMGSRRCDIFFRLISESTMMCFLSCILGLLLAIGFAPYGGTLLHTQLRVSTLFSPLSIIICVAGILVIGIVSGIFPASVISAAEPIEVVRGTFRRRTKMLFSKIFITIQNIITIVMIACALTMILQVQHMIHAPLGYHTDKIILISCPETKKADAFIARLHQLACVEDVARTAGTPFDGGNNQTVTKDGKTISFQYLIGDDHYMKLFGLTLDRDNSTMVPKGVYLNRQALVELGLKDDARSFNFDKEVTPIRGIVHDFHIRSIESEQHPLIVEIDRDMKQGIWGFAIKVKGDEVEALNEVRQVYKQVFNLDMNETNPYLDQHIRANYEQQIRMSTIVSIFAFMAILISLLGLIAMSTYFIQQRSREIAVRKVFGSSSEQMCSRLIRSFLVYVGVAFVVSIPIIFYFMNNWLSNYSYRISLSPWIFIVAGLFCFVISLVAVFVQSYQASNANPVNSIKDN